MNKYLGETSVAVSSLVLAGLVYWSADQIPASLLAKISAGLVPKAVAIALAGLAILQLMLMFFSISKGSTDLGESEETDAKHDKNGWKRIVIISILLGVFVAILDWHLMDFSIAATIFVFLSIVTLSDVNTLSLLKAFVVSIATVGLTVAIFTQLFTVILP